MEKITKGAGGVLAVLLGMRHHYLRLAALTAAIAFLAGFAVSHFDLARPIAVAVKAMLPAGGCRAETVNGICTGGSHNATPPYESAILAQIPPADPSTVVSDVADFPAFLRRAVGWDNIPRATIRCAPYAGNAVEECFADFGRLLTARFLSAPGRGDGPLLIILHGHVGQADKVMGLAPEDYMRRIGQRLAAEGYAVAAPDLTHDANVAARLNGQLVLHGIQIYGLWSRLVCDIAAAAGERPVIVYGLSNGGVIADHVSVLCRADNISLVFVDDILTDWRATLSGHPTIHAKQNYALHYLAPLRYRTSYLHFMMAGRQPKIYTRGDGRAPDSFPRDCLRGDAADDWRVLVAPLAVDYHVAQIELLREVLAIGKPAAGQAIDLECIGAALTPRQSPSARAAGATL